MTPPLIIHDMPEDVQRVLEALAKAADEADLCFDTELNVHFWRDWAGKYVPVEIFESAREILGRGK